MGNDWLEKDATVFCAWRSLDIAPSIVYCRFSGFFLSSTVCRNCAPRPFLTTNNLLLSLTSSSTRFVLFFAFVCRQKTLLSVSEWSFRKAKSREALPAGSFSWSIMQFNIRCWDAVFCMSSADPACSKNGATFCILRLRATQLYSSACHLPLECWNFFISTQRIVVLRKQMVGWLGYQIFNILHKLFRVLQIIRSLVELTHQRLNGILVWVKLMNTMKRRIQLILQRFLRPFPLRFVGLVFVFRFVHDVSSLSAEGNAANLSFNIICTARTSDGTAKPNAW